MAGAESELVCKTTYYAAGEESPDMLTLATAAWYELPELQLTSKNAFIQRAEESIFRCPRVEIVYYPRGSDIPIGGCVVVEEEDLHVGRCMSLMWQYVLPAYRSYGLAGQYIRSVRRLAREEGLPYAYSHRSGNFQYTVRYRR